MDRLLADQTVSALQALFEVCNVLADDLPTPHGSLGVYRAENIGRTSEQIRVWDDPDQMAADSHTGPIGLRAKN